MRERNKVNWSGAYEKTLLCPPGVCPKVTGNLFPSVALVKVTNLHKQAHR